MSLKAFFSTSSGDVTGSGLQAVRKPRVGLNTKRLDTTQILNPGSWRERGSQLCKILSPNSPEQIQPSQHHHEQLSLSQFPSVPGSQRDRDMMKNSVRQPMKP